MSTNCVTATKGQHDGLNCESYGKEVNGTRECLLKVHDFCTRSVREVGSVLEINGQRAEGDEET